MPNREVRTAVAGNTYRIAVQSGAHEWVLDEPVDEGGSDAGPSPVQAMLGALVSCLTISYQFQARRKNIPIERIEGWVAANEHRWIEQVSVELQVWSSASEGELLALLPGAKRGCYVSNVLRPDLDYTVDLVVVPATPTRPEG